MRPKDEWAIDSRAHEGGRNNCFSKIQLVGQKNIETKHLSLVKATMSDQSVETLGSKIRFSAFWKHFPSFPQNHVDFSISSTAQNTAPTRHLVHGPRPPK